MTDEQNLKPGDEFDWRAHEHLRAGDEFDWRPAHEYPRKVTVRYVDDEVVVLHLGGDQFVTANRESLIGELGEPRLPEGRLWGMIEVQGDELRLVDATWDDTVPAWRIGKQGHWIVRLEVTQQSYVDPPAP